MELKRMILIIPIFLISWISLSAQSEHTVLRGETFASIAKKYGISETELNAANPNSKVCYAGLKLKIPVTETGTIDTQSQGTFSTTSYSNARQLFEQAYNLPNSEIDKRIELFIKAANADPNNIEGVRSVACYNLGVLSNKKGIYKDAKFFYEKALEADPNYTDARENLKALKQERRRERWSIVGEVLSATGKAASEAMNSQNGNAQSGGRGTDGYYTATTSTSTSGTGGGGSKTQTKKCLTCRGSGKCEAPLVRHSNRCLGNGICQFCGGRTTTYAADGTIIKCVNCNGTGKCTFCKGTGKCSKCNGTGKG